jgi:light-regulated signal transduction histidine kinase (bacteriophytochrome)
MQQLVNDLLKFSKHTNDIFGFEKTDLNDIMSEVLSDIELHVHKKSAKISVNKLPVIWAIPSQIRQLFQNLISNSIKFTREGTVPEVMITSEKIQGAAIEGVNRQLANQTFYKICIKDNGIGFDPKYAEDIFVVFKRLHSYHEFEGTGIGLSICKKIVDKHNGYITAESTPDKGSTFVITLPEKSPVIPPIRIEEQTIRV